MPHSALLITGIFVLLELPIAITQCPPNTYNEITDFGRCYDIRHTSKTWIEAKRYCERESNGRLIQISSAAIAHRFRYTFGATHWTGGYSNQHPHTAATTTAEAAASTTQSLLSPSTTAPLSTSDTSNVNPTTSPAIRPTIQSSIATTASSDPVWYWSDTKGDTVIPSSVLTWASGEPRLDSGSGSCLAMTGYYIFTYFANQCTESFPFACEYSCQTHINDGNITTIQSWRYPGHYGSNMDCKWFIDVKVGHAILEFEDFVTEEPSTTDCTLDYLMVYETEDSTEPLTTLCGTASSARVVSPSRNLYLRFVSDSSINNRGFKATVVSSEAQDIRHLGGGHGVVTSPSFPLNYAKNSTMNWVIAVPQGLVNLNFTEFDLQPGSNTTGNCDYDYLEIRTGSEQGRLIGIYCGSSLPPVIKSNSSVLHLSLTTDNDTEKSGFRAVYWSDDETCVHIISSGGGSISSPGYPENYQPNLQCVWYIDVMQGTAKINFTDFNLEYSRGCIEDRVEVWDGRLNNGTKIITYCDRYYGSRRMNLTVQSQYITVFFQSDNGITQKGFRAEFKSSLNCSETLSGTKGVIAAPNYPNEYEPYSNCTWLIDVLSGNATLLINSFAFQYHEVCTYDKLEIYDGTSTNATKLGQFCGETNPGQIQATSRYMLVQMTTDGSLGGYGFSGEFWSSELSCLNLRTMDQTMKFNGVCYGFVNKRYYQMTLANDVCTSKNASLLYFYSRAEFNAVKKWLYDDLAIVSSYSYIWTSGYKRSGIDSWYWSLSTGDVPFNLGVTTDHFWAIGQPGYGGTNVKMSTRGLTSTGSRYSSSYVICKDTTAPPSSTGPSTEKPITSCSAPPNIRSGYYSPPQQIYINGSSITFKCDHSYELQGETTMQCIHGFWQSQLPVCRSLADLETDKSACAPPPTVLYATLTPQYPFYTNGTVVSYICAPDFEFISRSHQTLLCLSGLWQRAIPSCKAKTADRGPPATLPQVNGSNKSKPGDCTGVLAGTLPIIVLLMAVVVTGGIWFYIKYRRDNKHERLLEMQ